MDDKRFSEILDEEFQNENFRPLVDNREAIKAIRAEFSNVDFHGKSAGMTDKQVNEIYESMKNS